MTVSVLVANDGDAAASYEVVLKIDNVAEAKQTVQVVGHSSQTVTFTTTKGTTGTYSVSIDSLSGTFTVKAPSVPSQVCGQRPVHNAG